MSIDMRDDDRRLPIGPDTPSFPALPALPTVLVLPPAPPRAVAVGRERLSRGRREATAAAARLSSTASSRGQSDARPPPAWVVHRFQWREVRRGADVQGQNQGRGVYP